MNMPEPGLQGDYSDACAVCLHGTDTGVVFAGPAEVAILGLAAFGVPLDEATAMVCLVTTGKYGFVPEDDIEAPVRVCSPCAEGTPFKPGLIPFDTPVYRMES